MATGDAFALAVSELSALPLSAALPALKGRVRADLADFRRDVGWRLPASLESVTVSDIRQHLGPFLERTFRLWAERENAEVQQALSAIGARALGESEAAPGSPAEPATRPDSRLLRPSFDVSTFALDASVVAALALGVGALFANAALGGLFLLAAPTLAAFGKGHGERALRARAAESAMASVDDAVTKLGIELERMIDDFARRIGPIVTAS